MKGFLVCVWYVQKLTSAFLIHAILCVETPTKFILQIYLCIYIYITSKKTQ